MPGARDIVGAVHAAVVWLSMMFVFCGPLGLGVRTAAASGSSSCAVSCPCDWSYDWPYDLGEHAEHDDCNDEHDEGAPSNDECPDDCSRCGCGPVVAVAMLASTMSTTASPSSPDLQLSPSDVAATGVRTGVFRPPRSLA